MLGRLPISLFLLAVAFHIVAAHRLTYDRFASCQVTIPHIVTFAYHSLCGNCAQVGQDEVQVRRSVLMSYYGAFTPVLNYFSCYCTFILTQYNCAVISDADI
jgi:hypothetical protein